jgi:hypothetical protein
MKLTSYFISSLLQKQLIIIRIEKLYEMYALLKSTTFEEIWSFQGGEDSSWVNLGCWRRVMLW